jgi:site-specific DNA-methyltransferase (adenine-specific)
MTDKPTIQLHLGDCIEFMKSMPDKSVDCICVDPPYEFISKSPDGGGFMSNENKRHLHKIRDSFGMSFDPLVFLGEAKRVSKVFNAYIFTNKTLLAKYIEFAEVNGYKWEILLWFKPNAVPINNGHYLIDKEYLIYIKQSGAYFNSDLGYDKYFTIHNHPIGTKVTEHPTEKPVEFISKVLAISTKEGDTIADFYMGSGTTGVACKLLRRNFIGVEISPKYYELAKRRIDSTEWGMF